MKHRVLALALLALIMALVLMLAIVPVALAASDDAGTPVSIEATQLWALLVSVLVPFVTGLLVRKAWPKWSKALIALTLAAIIGVVTTLVTGNWTGDVWVIVAACFGVAQTTFFVVVDRVPGLKQWLYDQFGGAAPTTTLRE